MQDSMFNLHAYPLAWPEGWKRTPASQRRQPQFKRYGERLQVGNATQRVLEQLQQMSISRDDCLISTNLQVRLDGLPRADQKEPEDPGAAVYWRKGQNGIMRCIATDQYVTVAGNIGALAATLEAMRAIQRHGGAEILERTFQGFAALPQSTERPWRDVLDIPYQNVTPDQIETRYHTLARTRHPDVAGGSHEAMAELNAAREAALAEVGA